MSPPLTGSVAAEIEARLAAALAPTRLQVINDSAKHRGHAGDDGSGESHFTVEIEAAAFAGMSRLERQRAVNAALGDLMRERIHALSILARTPEQSASAMQGQVDYDGRDGEAEALAHIAGGGPLKFYYSVRNTVVPGFRVHGLLGLPRHEPTRRDIFVPLPEADFREGQELFSEEWRRRDSAFQFAKRFNQAMFRARGDELRRLYPDAKLAADRSSQEGSGLSISPGRGGSAPRG